MAVTSINLRPIYFGLTCLFLSSSVQDSLSFTARTWCLLTKTSVKFDKHSSLFASNAGVMYDDLYSEDDFSLFRQAEACIDSDSCPLEDAQMYLDDILHQQKECVGGGVLTTKEAICNNVERTVDLVANLRQKIYVQQRRRALVKPAVDSFNVILGVYIVSTILHGVAAVPNVPLDSPLFTDYSSYDDAFHRGVTSILPQEWLWSLRDGYFPQLFTEWFKNGGLVVDTSNFDIRSLLFTPQEWVWSIQNGSFGRILEEYIKYGGLVADNSDSNLIDNEMIPMRFQDLQYSIRDGYFRAAVKHFYRNGGL